MNFKAYYFLTLLSIIRSDLPPIRTIDNEYKTFIQNLIIKNFNSSTCLGIFHDNEGRSGINLIEYITRLHIPVMIHDLTTPEIIYDSSDIWVPKNNLTILRTQDNVMIIKNSKDLRSALEIAKSVPYFDARCNVLVIFTEIVSFTERWILEVFSELWKIYILNVGLVFYNDKVNLFTYIPWTSPFEIENLTDQGISANIFYDKLKDLRKYPVKVLHQISNLKMLAVNQNNSTSYIGVDGMTMRTLLERHNATSLIVTSKSDILSPCRFVHYNHTIVGLFGANAKNESIDICPYSLRLPKAWKKPSELDVIKYNIDVSFDSRPLRFDMDYRVDSSRYQQRDNYCIIIPAKIRISQSFNLLMPLNPPTWLGIALTFILQVTVHSRIQYRKRNNKGFVYTCLTLYRIQVNVAAPISRKLRTSEQAHLLCWVLYCFLISAAYQSNFVSFITVPFYKPPLNRLHELKGTGLPILASSTILADMPNAIDTETSHIILENLVLEVWSSNRSIDIKKGYLVPESTARYLLQRKDLLAKDGTSLFHLMEECPMPVFTTYQMPRGSPLLQIINKFTPRKIESGLMNIWEAQGRSYLNSQISARVYGKELITLTMMHLQGAFYIFFIGQTIATSVFLCEFYRKQIGRFIPMKGKA